jgi:hypothetical protein
MSECKCNLREKLVGDGCEVCNPTKALEYAKDTIAELESRLREIETWTPVTDRLPESGKPVLVACGKKVLRAVYAAKHALDDENWKWWTDGDGSDYDETTDKTYWPEGWYEWNEYEECHWGLDTAPTHWMPLPECPQGE